MNTIYLEQSLLEVNQREWEDKLFLNLNNKTLIEHTINKVKKYFKEFNYNN